VVECYRDETVDHTATEGGISCEDYAARKLDSGDSAIRAAAKDGKSEFVAASLLQTSGASYKYIEADDGKVRNRKIVSEKQPKSWLDSFQTKVLPPLPPAKMPHHNAASGHIGSIDSDSQSSFLIPQALTRPAEDA